MPYETNLVITIKVHKDKETNHYWTDFDIVENNPTITSLAFAVMQLNLLSQRFMADVNNSGESQEVSVEDDNDGNN